MPPGARAGLREQGGLARPPLVTNWPDMKRPANLVPPRTLTPSPPVPEPAVVEPTVPAGEEDRPDPTRFGDWERKGIAIDF